MIPAFFFGVMLVLAQMTTLRGQSSVGALDILLIASGLLALATALELNLRQPAAAPMGVGSPPPQAGFVAGVASPLSLFAFGSALAITVSLLLNIQRPAASAEDMATAAIPFYANALLLLCFVILLYSRHVRGLIWGFSLASLLVAVGYTIGAIIQLPQMYVETRFAGFASNPNQSALQALATFVALLICLVKLPQRQSLLKLVIYAAMPLTLIYGLFTVSDSLILALPPALAAAGLVVLDRFRIPLWVAVFCSLLLFILFLVGLAIAVPDIFGGVGSALQAQFTVGNQDTDRQALWNNGLEAWGNSFWWGNGPGAWSGLGGPYQGQEAHNSIIDWLSIAGLIGIIPHMYLMIALARVRPRFRLFRFACFLALFTFTMFHFTFRLPVFWFAMALIIAPFFSWADDIRSDPVRLGKRVPRSPLAA